MTEVNVQVAVRIRPLLPAERLHHHRESVRVIPGTSQVLVTPDKFFNFDYAFGPSCGQDEVYRSCVQPMVRSLMDGYSATVFCYGETGSGKTYTISGQDDQAGIVEHVARDVFGFLDERMKNHEVDAAEVHVSYLELYMEEVRDLLDLPTNQKGLAVRNDINGNTVVVGAKESAVHSAEELLSLVEMSSAARHTCATGMNDKSSRSHTVLTILINQHCSNKLNAVCSSKFCLVDLAGSERVKKTGNTGKHFKETIHINTDLLAVGNVIRALTDRALNHFGKTRKGPFIPFRDAKITRLLRDSLGGTSHTLMMTCLNPSNYSVPETINALRFSTKARHIRNHPARQRTRTDEKYNPKFAEIRISELENEVKLLKEVIEEKQMMIKEVALETVSSDQMTEDVKFNQSEPLEYSLLAQEAARLLAKVSGPRSSFKQQLQDWQKRFTAVNQQHPEEALTVKEEQKDQTDSEQHLLERSERKVQMLLQENKDYLQGFEEDRRWSVPEHELYLEQQMLISHLHNDLLARTSVLEAGSCGTADITSQSVCLRRHCCNYESTRRVHSSPPAYSLERVMADFKMRSHILLAENEENNNKSLLTKRHAQSRDMDEVEEDTIVTKRGLRTNLNKTQTWFEENSGSNDGTEQTSLTISTTQTLQSADYIHANQLKDKEKLKSSETKKRLRDLSVIMGIKKDLIKELVKTEKELKDLLKDSRCSSEGKGDVLHTLSMHSQQVQAQVYSSLQHMKKQRAELQARLNQIEETSSDSQTTNLAKGPGVDLVNNSSEQNTLVEKLPVSCWLEMEEELELRRRAELQNLEHERKRRDEVLKHREACAQQINKLESKMRMSSQIYQNLGEDLLRVSMSLDSLERGSMELQSGDSAIGSQEEEKRNLKKKKESLEAQLQDSKALSVEEVESLVLLEEDCEALNAALEFENSCIQERQKMLNLDSSSNQSPSAEPDQLADVIRKIRRLPATEASELLITYFNKVVCLRETLQNLHLRCEELELIVRENEMTVNKMDSDRQRLTLDADRRLTQLQRDHQISIQQLLQKLKGGPQQAGEEKRKYLEGELLYYKSYARELKKKFRESGAEIPQLVADGQEKPPNTQPSTSERDPLAEIKTRKQTVAEEGGERGTTHSPKRRPLKWP